MFWRSGLGNFARAGWIWRWPFVRFARPDDKAPIIDDRLPSERVPWHTLSEAELTEKQEHEAQANAAREWRQHGDR